MGGPSNINNPLLKSTDYGKAFADSQKELEELLKQAPLQQPDLADPVNQAARASQLLTAQTKRGRASTFLPDPPAAVGTKSFLGG